MKKRRLIIASATALFFSMVAVLTYLLPGQGGGDRSTGRALIGGNFTLVNHKGETMSDRDFRGKFMLVYFGYTFCPDICPNELGVMSQALDLLGEKAERITPVFITVDPTRDTVSHMAEYIANFHKSFIALTGSQMQTKAVAKVYKVYSSKAKDSSSSTEYLMDHSSAIYLMSPTGKYVTHFSFGTKPERIAKEFAELLG